MRIFICVTLVALMVGVTNAANVADYSEEELEDKCTNCEDTTSEACGGELCSQPIPDFTPEENEIKDLCCEYCCDKMGFN